MTVNLVRLALQVMNRLSINRGRFRILELLDVFLGKLRTINFDLQFVKLGR